MRLSLGSFVSHDMAGNIMKAPLSVSILKYLFDTLFRIEHTDAFHFPPLRQSEI